MLQNIDSQTCYVLENAQTQWKNITFFKLKSLYERSILYYFRGTIIKGNSQFLFLLFFPFEHIECGLKILTVDQRITKFVLIPTLENIAWFDIEMKFPLTPHPLQSFTALAHNLPDLLLSHFDTPRSFFLEGCVGNFEDHENGVIFFPTLIESYKIALLISIVQSYLLLDQLIYL